MPEPTHYLTSWREAKPTGDLPWRVRLRRRVRGGMLSALAAVRRGREARFLRCLYGHHVFADQRADFRHLLGELRRGAEFVDTPTCLRMLKGETAIDGRYFHLSFDDGFLNLAQNAAPVLAELKIPAIFFVPTALMGSHFQEAAQFFVGSTSYAGPLEFMSWATVAELAAGGFEIGSHTRHHARLADLHDPDALAEEIVRSKGDLEERLGQPCRYFSWPYGRRRDVSAVALDAIRQAGYEGCFGAFRGRLSAGVTSPFEIPRHHFEVDWPLSHVRFFAEGNLEKE